MTISRLITAVIESGPHTGAKRTVPLRLGSLLQGEVIDIRPEGKTLVEFGNVRVLADLPFAVKPGTTFQVRVDGVGKPLQLTLLPSTADKRNRGTSDQLPRTLSQEAAMKQLPGLIDRVINQGGRGTSGRPFPETIRQALHALRNFCLPLDLTNQTVLIARQLKQGVENSGLYFEHRLARWLSDVTAMPDAASPPGRPAGTADAADLIRSDLKANLLIVKTFLDHNGQKDDLAGVSPKDIERLNTTLGQLLGDIEDRIQTVIKNRDAAYFLFSHILTLFPAENRGLLRIRLPAHQQNADDADVRLSLLLQMDRIGHIRSDLWLTTKGLRVTLLVADSGVKNQIDSHLQTLDDLLHRHFGQLSINVRVADPVDMDIDTAGRWATGFFQQRTIDTTA